MRLENLLDVAKLEQHIANGEIKKRRHLSEPLTIYNYGAKCQFDRIWTHETKTCRGLIVDDAGGVVCRPFPKFFNIGEHTEPLPTHEPHSIHEKLDGSLGIAYVRPSDGKTAISTRGAFHSPQAEHATAWLQKHWPWWQPPAGETWLFEIIYSGSRVVVDYGSQDECVLLARMDNETGRDLPVHTVAHPFRMAALHDLKWEEMQASMATLRGLSSEGFVIRFHGSGLRVKAKTDDYARLHRLVCGLSSRAVWEVLSKGDSFEEFLSAVPDEFMEWVKAQRATLQQKFRDIETAAAVVVGRTVGMEDRKAKAEFITANAEHPAVCFMMLGGQRGADESRVAPAIWKLLYPPHETFRTVNEDVA